MAEFIGGTADLASYATNPACPCLSDLSDYGLEGDLIANISDIGYNYGPAYGLHRCFPHDSGTKPFCHLDGSPGWCTEEWCYVDPTKCEAGIEVVKSSYFDSLHYSTMACGSGRDDFAPWYGSNGTAGAFCERTVQCLGAQTICNIDSTCGCRRNMGQVGPECTILTPQSAWPLTCCTLALLAYMASLAYQLRILWRTSAFQAPSSRTPARLDFIGEENSIWKRLRAIAQSHQSQMSIIFCALSAAFMSVDLVMRLATLANGADKLLFDLITTLFQTLSASSAVVGFGTLCMRWLNAVEATRKLSRIDGSRVRRSRAVVICLTCAFAVACAALVVLMLFVSGWYYQLLIGLDMLGVLTIIITYQYGAHRLRSMVKAAEATLRSGRSHDGTTSAVEIDGPTIMHGDEQPEGAAGAPAGADLAEEQVYVEMLPTAGPRHVVIKEESGGKRRNSATNSEDANQDRDPAAPRPLAAARSNLAPQPSRTSLPQHSTTGRAAFEIGVPLISCTARRVSACLCFFLVAAVLWLLSRQFQWFIGIEWISVLVMHVGVAGGHTFVAHYTDEAHVAFVRRPRQSMAVATGSHELQRGSSPSARGSKDERRGYSDSGRSPSCHESQHRGADSKHSRSSSQASSAPSELSARTQSSVSSLAQSHDPQQSTHG